MNAINHAATALLVKRRWPSVPLVPALIAVQFIELLWVLLNLIGAEVTTTEPEVQSLRDIHLIHMPYSHSIASTLALGVVAWFVLTYVMNRPKWAWPIAIGICSHIVLDVLVHAPDIEIVPIVLPTKIGTGLYNIPVLALIIETLYGVVCWRVFRGSVALLVAIVVLNLASISFYVPQIAGPESLLAGRPKVFATVILIHIIVGWVAIWFFARRALPKEETLRSDS